jgi:hypothetical protein
VKARPDARQFRLVPLTNRLPSHRHVLELAVVAVARVNGAFTLTVDVDLQTGGPEYVVEAEGQPCSEPGLFTWAPIPPLKNEEESREPAVP